MNEFDDLFTNLKNGTFKNNKNFNFSFKKIFDFNKKLNSFRKKFFTILAILFALIFYYFVMPPISLKSREFWLFLGILSSILTLGSKSIKIGKVFISLTAISFLVIVSFSLFGSQIFNAKKYSNIITLKESDFNKDIQELPIQKIPTLDKEASIKLGSRKMGELIDLVSQFDIDDTTYTQINYKNKPIRVTPLKYNGFIKYVFNMSNGIPGYLKIDIVTGKSELVKLQKPIRYSKEDYFFRNIYRYARIKYPFDIFYDANFEIDENGEPYWIIPTYSPKISLFDGLDVNGAILINASTGEHKKYAISEVPQWVDRVYNADKIIDQLNWNGKYKGGFINSLFTQKNVMKTTKGYNYLALNDDIYLYTGYTSVASDESNVGFILTNLRTKETKFYPISSAEEFSAMESAKGAVQEKGYQATFPLLLNIKSQPTYFLSLKDAAGLIKLYAFIDAQNYQNVAVGSTVEQALANHLNNFSTKPNINGESKSEIKEISGKISEIHEVVIEGNSYYYFKLENNDNIYIASLKTSEKLPFVKSANVKFKYQKEANLNKVILFDELK